MGLMKWFSMIFKVKASKTLDRYEDQKFQQSAEQLPQRLLSRLAKSWRAWQADILTRHVNGGCSNGCTGAINVLIRSSSASTRFRDFANCLATAAIRRHVADSPNRKTAEPLTTLGGVEPQIRCRGPRWGRGRPVTSGQRRTLAVH
jgi:hypothetical protein